jgi:hypothetical protein
MVTGVRVLTAAVVVVGAGVIGCGGGASQDLFGEGGAGDGGLADATTVDPGPDGSVEADAAGPLAYFSAAGIDFGLAECAGAAPADQSIILANLGGETLTWSASLAGASAIGFNGPRQGTLAPGARATITVAAQAFPKAAIAGESLQATLTVVTNDLSHAKALLPVKVTPAGGTLTLTPASVSFGQVPVRKQAADIPLLLANVGNVPVEVTLGAPSDAQFALGWSGTGAITLGPGAAVPGLVAQFNPSAAKAASATATVSVRGVTCGVGVPSVTLKGEGTNGTVSASPGALFFGEVPCGSMAASQTVKLSNSGNAPFTFTTSLDLGAASPYSVLPASGAVAPGASIDLEVKPAAIPASSLTTADLLADTLVVATTSAGDTPHRIALHETAKGARIHVSRPSIAFGDVPVGTDDAEPLSFANDGNAAATLTLTASGSDYEVSPVAPTATPAGGTLSATATFRPAAIGPVAGRVAVTTADALCAPLPPDVTFAGTGTRGEVSLSTQSLDFQSVPCGTRGAAQTVRLQNTGNAALRWTGALGRADSPFSVDVAAGALGAGESVTITVTPEPIPAVSATTAGFYDDALVITTDVPLAPAFTVKLLETARGAVLELDPPALTVPPTPLGSASVAPFTLRNRGNAPATVTLSPAPSTFAVTPASATVPPATGGAAGTLAGELTYTPGPDVGPESGTVGISTADPVCAPLPALLVTATALGGVLRASPAPGSTIDLGLVDCGTAGVATRVVVTNDGNALFTVTPSLGAVSPPRYSVTPGGASPVAPGKSLTFTVTPQVITVPASVAPNAYGDRLTLATNIPGDAPHTFDLARTAQGAILSYPTSHVFFATSAGTTSPPFDLALTNRGNAPAAVVFSPTATSPFAFAPGTVAVGAASSASTGVTYSPAPPGPRSDVESIPVGVAGTVLCEPLPGSIELRGEAIP